MALGVLRLSRSFVPPAASRSFVPPAASRSFVAPAAAAALFTVACAPLHLRRTAPTALLSTATALRLRLRCRWLRLRLSALPLSFPTLRFPTLRFAASGTLLFVTTSAVSLFVAAAPLFGAFGSLMGMTPPARLPAGFRVGAGDRDVRRQRKRTASGNRAALSASVS